MTNPAQWQHLGHAEIHALAHQGPGAGVSMPAEDLWRRVSEILAAGEAAMDRAVRRSEGMWEGSTSDGARSGLHELNSWVRDAATDASNTVSGISHQGEHAAHLRATVPEPYDAAYTSTLELASQNPDNEEMQRAVGAAQQVVDARDEDARRKLAIYHYDSVRNRDIMDIWTAPPTILVETAAAAPVGLAGGGAGSPASAIGDALGANGAGPPTGVAGAGGAAPAGAGAGAGAGTVAPGGPLAPGGGGTGGAAAPVGPVGVPGSAGAGSPVGSTGVTARTGGSAGAGPPGTVSPVGAASPTGRGTGPAPTRRAHLPPGAGGRGPRATPLTAPATPGGVRPVAPRVPSTPQPAPTWRDLVAANRAPEGVPRAGDGGAGRPTVPGDGSGRPATVPGQPGSTAPSTRPEPAGPGRAAAAGTAHGLYPPTAGAPAAGGETRRRAPYLVDDAGVFDVEHLLHVVDPVIRGTDQEPRR